MQQSPIELGESTGRDVHDGDEEPSDSMIEGAQCEHDRTSQSMANDDPRSAPESGDKDP